MRGQLASPVLRGARASNGPRLLDGMRVEQLLQTARGFSGTYESPITKESILKELERMKWFLWHGNLFQADETLTDLIFEVDGAIEEDTQAKRPAHVVLKKLGSAHFCFQK